MPKFRLNAEVTVSCWCEIEAESQEEALEISDGMSPALHFNGSGTFPEENWLIEDSDGTPTNVKIEQL